MKRETVTSAQNPKIKELLSLQDKPKARRESGLFVVEGVRELEHCMEGGYKLRSLFVCPSILGEEQMERLAAAAGCTLIEVPETLYGKIAYRGSTEGAMAEVYARELTLDSLKLPENALVVVCEGVEKPGNVGAMLRTCDAAGVDALILARTDGASTGVDIYNPNLIRASVGALFTVPVAVCGTDEAICFLKTRKLRILTAQLQDSSPYYDCDMRMGTAIVMGTESTGLSDEWRRAADAHIRIPMLGKLDSLNVSVSAAVLIYESVRQRQNG